MSQREKAAAELKRRSELIAHLRGIDVSNRYDSDSDSEY